MLASTVQFSTNNQPTTTTPHTSQNTSAVYTARSCLECRSPKSNHNGLFLQDSTGCLSKSFSRTSDSRSVPQAGVLGSPAVAEVVLASVSAFEHPGSTCGNRGLHAPFQVMVLLRKEVIQPHLPVRLPCYDFVPIASPTFDSSLPVRLGHGLRVLPTFVT